MFVRARDLHAPNIYLLFQRLNICMIIAWSFDHLAVFSILIYSSAGYYLSGQVIEVSFRLSDSLVALYLLHVLLLVCQTSLSLDSVKTI